MEKETTRVGFSRNGRDLGLRLEEQLCLKVPVMGASGFSQLIRMEVSPTSSTSCSVGESGAGEQVAKVRNGGFNERI